MSSHLNGSTFIFWPVLSDSDSRKDEKSSSPSEKKFDKDGEDEGREDFLFLDGTDSNDEDINEIEVADDDTAAGINLESELSENNWDISSSIR